MTPRELARSYVDEGRVSVSPKEAAAVLGVKPYSLNVSANKGRLNIPHFFSGCRLRISASGLLAYVEGGVRSEVWKDISA